MYVGRSVGKYACVYMGSSLKLWGAPAFLVTPTVDCPGVAAVKRAAPVLSAYGEVTGLSNFFPVHIHLSAVSHVN